MSGPVHFCVTCGFTASGITIVRTHPFAATFDTCGHLVPDQSGIVSIGNGGDPAEWLPADRETRPVRRFRL